MDGHAMRPTKQTAGWGTDHLVTCECGWTGTVPSYGAYYKAIRLHRDHVRIVTAQAAS